MVLVGLLEVGRMDICAFIWQLGNTLCHRAEGLLSLLQPILSHTLTKPSPTPSLPTFTSGSTSNDFNHLQSGAGVAGIQTRETGRREKQGVRFIRSGGDGTVVMWGVRVWHNYLLISEGTWLQTCEQQTRNGSAVLAQALLICWLPGLISVTGESRVFIV